MAEDANGAAVMPSPPRGPMQVAAFVKTPGFSPVKTRLASNLGQMRATHCYNLSCAAIAAVLRQASQNGLLTPYWAVAEPDAADRWPDFKCAWQGAGGLGERLATVFQQLFSGGPPVLIGADAPQLVAADFYAVQERLSEGYDFVLGPARDGGFYLLAAQTRIPSQVWTSISYSVPTTAEHLRQRLANLGDIYELEMLTDIDTVTDLEWVSRELARRVLLPEQGEMLLWLQTIMLKKVGDHAS